ncbi:O-antigen polymerase [Psychrobacter sp. BF1]|uniref:O-antigen polymerase n=1 Tax=Psychrobacter sp. BF1 TaxID=2821147 RepID=UPI001C4DE370|nr:O-antigen polymerase [Psychrobacter sp. BF1]
MIKNLIIIILMFSTLFPISFSFLPSVISTRFIAAILGSFILFLSIMRRRKIRQGKMLTVFMLTILVSVWSFLCTLIFNLAGDYTYVKLPVTIFIIYLSSYLCLSAIKSFHGKVDFNLVTKYFIYTIVFQSIIVIAQFSSPEIAGFLIKIQRLTEEQAGIANYHLEDGSRFIGFGLLFYTASFFYGTALVLIAFQLKYNGYNRKELIVSSLLYLFIFFVGMGLSRTTVVGFITSMLLIIFPINNFSILLKLVFKFIIYIFLIVLSVFTVLKLFPNLFRGLDNLIGNAFDFFISYINTGSVSSESASGTLDFLVFPEQASTYIVGTGLYEMYSSIGDFNYSDIGYLRLIYYFGFPGLVLFFLVEIKILNLAFKRKKLLPIYYSMLVILLVTNFKGLTTLAVIAMMFALIPNDRIEESK